LKNFRSREVSEVVLSVNPSVLRELRENIRAAVSPGDDAQATADEVREGSADAQDSASETQGDAIDSVQSSNADRVSGFSAISSGTGKTSVGWMKSESEKRNRR
jgi:hypothetical protein